MRDISDALYIIGVCIGLGAVIFASDPAALSLAWLAFGFLAMGVVFEMLDWLINKYF